MDREILFKGFHPCKNGKDKVFVNGEWINGEWVEGYYWKDIWGDNTEYIYYDGEDYEVIPETVGEYTGLTDKNGKKIFEGDITKHRSNYSSGLVIAVVTYTDSSFLAMVDRNAGFSLSDKLEIIGNIHANPELLEVAE